MGKTLMSVTRKKPIWVTWCMISSLRNPGKKAPYRDNRNINGWQGLAERNEGIGEIYRCLGK